VPELGVIGKDSGIFNERFLLSQPIGIALIKQIVNTGQLMLGMFMGSGPVFGLNGHTVGRDDSQGNPSPPSYAMRRPGRIGPFFFPLTTGAHTISVDVKYGPSLTMRPRLIVHEDQNLGINAELIAIAASGTGWVTVASPLFTLRQAGVVEVFLEMLDQDMDAAFANWDNFSVA
jgi:hypothetical protein